MCTHSLRPLKTCRRQKLKPCGTGESALEVAQRAGGTALFEDFANGFEDNSGIGAGPRGPGDGTAAVGASNGCSRTDPLQEFSLKDEFSTNVTSSPLTNGWCLCILHPDLEGYENMAGWITSP